VGESYLRALRAALVAAAGLTTAFAAFAQGQYGPVGGNETLWAVAQKVNQGRSSTTAQMAWALYRANPQAFNGSPDRIRNGATLRVPDAAFVSQVAADQAYAYITGRATPPASRADRTAEPAPPPVAAAPPPAAFAPPGITTTPLAAAQFSGSEQQREADRLAQVQGAGAVYGFLLPLEDQYAGDADYDYRLGASALDTGRFSHAIFVLQRAVATRPGFAGARMELARAYYAQGDNESARREFAILEKDNPPPEARRAIAEYQAGIARRAAAYERQLSGYAELASGYDSNANGAPDIDSFLGVQLDSRNRSAASAYYSLGVGGVVSHPFAPAWRILGTGNAAYRANPDASFVDSQALRVGAAVDWRPSQWELSLQPGFATVMLDGEDNHQVAALDAAATRHFEQARLSLNVRHSQTRYADELDVLDVDTLLYGLAAQYTTLAMPRFQWLASFTLGSDDPAGDGTPSYGRDLVGGRLGAIVDFGRGHSALLSVASLTADYDDVFFSAGTRKDEQLGATLAYEWGGLRAIGWTLRAQANYVDNSSNETLYDYERLEAGVSVRKEFR